MSNCGEEGGCGRVDSVESVSLEVVPFCQLEVVRKSNKSLMCSMRENLKRVRVGADVR